ncbi:MAG TPA: adenosylmethionine--8-amino-7-oxononanoate transaminase [Candidatus Acidoferrales bacterium]|nr:adenosylmethionine--8-amino-7-oxononanoate transaminase [Candidatus Acidoferrales bacterium]
MSSDRTRRPSPRSFVWLPFTQMSSFDPNRRTFVRARGTELVDSMGKTTFDAVSSIWTTIHGHCHPYITEAIGRQAGILDHATALGATNPVAEELAQRLCERSGLSHVFFASDGASAVEAALKMALQFWQNAGHAERQRFVHLHCSYHGDTVGAMSVSDIAVFRDRFAPFCFETIAFERFEDVIARPDIAAVIVEPLVQAAAGMRVVPVERYRSLAAPMAPLLIVDEVATGFGRTGTFFATEQTGMKPDLLCIGKGLSGGALALSATLATTRVYEAFSSSPSELRHFFHGHSYAANPIACAAALASLELFEREQTLAHVASLAQHLAVLLAQLRDDPRIAQVRHLGLMSAIEIVPERFPSARSTPTPAWNVADAMYERGHFTRPLGNAIQLVPPLSSSTAELDSFVEALVASLP